MYPITSPGRNSLDNSNQKNVGDEQIMPKTIAVIKDHVLYRKPTYAWPMTKTENMAKGAAAMPKLGWYLKMDRDRGHVSNVQRSLWPAGGWLGNSVVLYTLKDMIDVESRVQRGEWEMYCDRKKYWDWCGIWSSKRRIRNVLWEKEVLNMFEDRRQRVVKEQHLYL